MVSLDLLAEYAGARATPGLVNREQVLAKIHAAVQAKDTRVIYVRGDGGVGKTFLLRAVLTRCQPGGEWYQDGLVAAPPERLVDLYHTAYHTREGLARALRESIREGLARALREGIQIPGKPFAQFDEAFEEWHAGKFNLAGMLKELSELRARLEQAFLQDWANLSRRRRLVIALDTAERLLYGEDEIQRRLRLKPERVASLDWLLDVLPQLDNTVVLIAGRPKPEQLRIDLKQALGDRLTVVDLDRLDLVNTKAYFDAVAKAAQAVGTEEEAKRVAGMSDDVREVIWHCTDGRPILLALMIDYLVVADELLPQVKRPVKEIRGLSPKRLKDAREEIQQDLIRFWQETGRWRDQAVIALAWARKGMDAELLARVVELQREDGAWDVAQAQDWLDGISDLSFVKVRPADNRVFLHDEMYDLFERHLLSQIAEPRRGRVYRAILGYYRERILAQRQRVQELRTPRHEKSPDWDRTPLGQPRPPDDPGELARATNLLYNLMAEEVHYRLRQNPMDGFQVYQLYAKEAFWASDENLDHLLGSELLLFLDEHHGEPQFDGLGRVEVEVDLALRRLERYNRHSNRHAPDYAGRLRAECGDLLDRASPMDPVRLNVLEGEALLYIGVDFTAAEGLLREAIAALEEFTPSTRLEEWQRPILLAEAYNDLGYLYRTLGWFQRAAEVYRSAVDQWRSLEQREQDYLRRLALRAQHANTLNNQAWALAELGRFEEAGHTCEDALEMREALGSGAPIAFSLNTLGLILTRDDKPHRARVQCERALAIFRDLGQPRGIGLASIALAEALRRMSAVPRLYSPEEAAALLRRAAQHATDAVEVFRENGKVPERPRLVEALIERGCVYRQWAWLRPQYESSADQEQEEDPDQEELTQRGEKDLGSAIDMTEKDLPFRHLDAYVNLAWLHYYVRSNEQAEEEVREAIRKVPSEYLFGAGRDRPAENLPHTYYWFLLGKAYLLRGQVAIRRFTETQEGQHLRQAGRFYTLSLAYDELFAPDFRDIRRAIRAIYDRLRGLNRQEIDRVFEGIADAVQEFGLAEPTRFDRVLPNHNLPRRLTV